MSFVHLHLHTQYSFLDGAIKIDDLIKKVKNLGMNAVAITDHGGLFGVVEFYLKAIKEGIKPIIGMEGYFTYGRMEERKKEDSPYHILLLAKNEEGYKNLIKISSISYLKGFYGKPRFDFDTLLKHHKGLIIGSACIEGILAKDIRKGNIEVAREHAALFKELKGEDFYIEIMRVGIPDEDRVNEELLKISRDLDIPIIATNDAHYLNREDHVAHDVLLAIQTNKKLEDDNRMRFPSSEFYVKSPEEMEELFSDLPEAIKNTVQLAEKIEYIPFETGKYHMPEFDIPPEFSSPGEYLKHLVEEGIKSKMAYTEEVRERINYELSVISRMGFEGYFLIINDIVKSAREMGIFVGPGRGSAAGSLVLYALGITEINPLEHNLIFERFLNPERISMPDIDIDFEDTRRKEVIDYIREKYGENRVAQICSFNVLKAKAVIRDVGRVMNYDNSDINKIAKLIDADTLEQALEKSEELKTFINSREDLKTLFDIAKKLEGLTRHHGIHASGIVITPDDLTEHIPLATGGDNGDRREVKTQYEMNILEKLGFLKVDILGLNTLSVIRKTLEYIKEPIDLALLDKSDPAVYKLLSEGDTIGVFQLEEAGARSILRKFKPSNFSEIVLVLALIRPGPLQVIDLESLIRKKEGIEKVRYPHPVLEEILKETYGYPIFQEQAMLIANKLCGFSFGKADILRKAMGKKDMEIMISLREDFVSGAVENGLDKETAEQVFADISTFASYAFNKSHSTVYGELSFRTAYLKAHYPVEFLAATMTSEIGKTDKLKRYILDAQRHGITVTPPDINRSGFEFIPEEGKILYGLGAIKNVGESAVLSIIKEREENGKFRDFDDFLERCMGQKVNKRVVESLIKAGAFEKMDSNRRKLLYILNNTKTKRRKSPQKGLFQKEDEKIDVGPPSEDELRNYEQEALGFYFLSHPMKSYQYLIGSVLVSSYNLEDYPDDKLVICGGTIISSHKKKSKNGGQFYELVLEDLEGSYRVTMSETRGDAYRDILINTNSIAVKGRVSRFGNKVGVRAEEVYKIEDIPAVLKRAFLIIDVDEMDDKQLEKAHEIITSFKGSLPLFLLFRSREEQLKLKSLTKVKFDKDLIYTFTREIGEGKLRFVF